jgi:hypothetical protein
MALNPPIGGSPPLSFEDRWGPTNSSFKERWDAMQPNRPANTSRPPPNGPATIPWGWGHRTAEGNPMVQALQGQPDPAISAMFSHPAEHLQKMAGDVLSGPTHWQGPPPAISPAQAGGAAGMWNISRNQGPYAVDTLGVHVHPEAKRLLEMMAGPNR